MASQGRTQGHRAGGRAAGLAALLLVAAAPAAATTLKDALAAAYATNPALDAERAGLRAVDEQAAIARAGGRPQLGVEASVTQGLGGLRALNGYNRAILAGASMALPVYQGGRVRNAVAAADLRSEAGRDSLLAAEGDTFMDVATAYLDVLRDREILGIVQANVAALDELVRSNRIRLDAGDVTRTDVAQSLARAQQGQSSLASAEAALVASEQNYRRLVGAMPDTLEMPAPLARLPATADEAVATALGGNAALRSLANTVAAARRDVSSARSAALPSLTVGAASNMYSYRDRFGGIGNVTDDAHQVSATLSVPLYQGGLVGAQVRQARNRQDEAIDRREAAERGVEANARAAFASWQAAVRGIAATEHAVSANSEALDGVRTEAGVGARQILDVLNAQLELLSSRVALIRVRRDAFLAGVQLLNVMGMLDHRQLDLGAGPGYDPQVNYRRAVGAVGDFAGRASRAQMGYGPPAPR